MASVVQFGRRKGSIRGESKRRFGVNLTEVSSAEENSSMIQPPDLRKITVLSKAEWLRIDDEMNQVNKDKESKRETVKQREALHLQSQEVVKQWSNTIAGQRQKKLEAKKIRDELEEERKKLIDKDEAKYQEKMRKEAIEKARTQLYYQTDRVRGLHGALLLTEVLKEREAQIELKQRIKSASRDVDKRVLDMVKTREDEALRQEEEQALQKKLERLAVAKDLKEQIKESERVKEREKIENKKVREEIQCLQEAYKRELRMEEERQAQQKRELMQAHLEHQTNMNLIRAADARKQEAEEEQRKLFLSAKQKMVKLRKDRETELFREAQMLRERIMDKLTVTQQEQTDNEEQRIAKAVAEQDAKLAQKQWEEVEKRATMLKSITAYRESTRREKEEREEMSKQHASDTLQAKKDADRIYSEKQQLKAQQIKEDMRNIQDFNTTQMAEKRARRQQLRREEHEFDERTAELIAEEDNQFQQYAQQILSTATEAQRNVFPLYKAARGGIGGGFGPGSSGAKPIFLVRDNTGAQMPKYVSPATHGMKKQNEAVDIQDAKRRLGLTW